MPQPWFSITNTAGEPRHAGSLRITPFNQTWQLRFPGLPGGLIWNRPTAVLVTDPQGQDQVLAVPDPTREAILKITGYTLLAAIRRQALKGTELARAQCCTIRLKLLKIGAVLIRHTRRVRFLLSSSYPYQSTFVLACSRLNTS